MKYWIVGVDGKTYGPVGSEEIREWIAQRRADQRTLILPEGAASWTHLGLLPEFAAALSSTPSSEGTPMRGASGSNGTNGFAIAGLVCGVLSWLCCFCCCCPLNLLGIIFSIIALAQINAQKERQEGRGLAIAGLVLSVTSLLFALLLGCLNIALGAGQGNWPPPQLYN